jgi:hypothetical protein
MESTLKLQLQQKINEAKRGYKEALDFQECNAEIFITIYGGGGWEPTRQGCRTGPRQPYVTVDS